VDPNRWGCSTIGCAQRAIALWLFCLVAVTVALIDFGARNEQLALWMDREREARVRQARSTFVHKGFYDTVMDQMLLDDVPNADFSKGGVCLIGSSTVVVATRLWDLPVDQRRLIHNFGFPGTCHALQFHWLRYLIEHRQMLRAGGDKTLVIVGTHYGSANCKDEPRDPFPYSLRRYGLYDFDRDQGIRSVPIHPLRRSIEIEKARIPGFLAAWYHFATVHVQLILGIDPAPCRVHRPNEYNDFSRKSVMGSNWERKVDIQVAEFGRMVDYIRDRKARLVVVLLPLGSWDNQIPFEGRYNAAMTTLCRAKGVPLYDWSRMLDDEDFGDASHVNLLGTDKLHPALLDIGLRHLRAVGAIQ
jgi:hypothetical protein